VNQRELVFIQVIALMLMCYLLI